MTVKNAQVFPLVYTNYVGPTEVECGKKLFCGTYFGQHIGRTHFVEQQLCQSATSWAEKYHNCDLACTKKVPRDPRIFLCSLRLSGEDADTDRNDGIKESKGAATRWICPALGSVYLFWVRSRLVSLREEVVVRDGSEVDNGAPAPADARTRILGPVTMFVADEVGAVFHGLEFVYQ